MNDFSSTRGTFRRGITILMLLAIVLTFRSVRGGLLRSATTGESSSSLAACEGDIRLFPRAINIPAGKTLPEEWAIIFRARVGAVIEDYKKQLASGDDALSAAQQSLANDLGEKNARTKDVPRLVREYLDEYECALETESFVVEAQAIDALSSQSQGAEAGIGIAEFGEAVGRERSVISEELAIERPAVHRTLLYLSGSARFAAIGNILQTLAGATVDIRNGLDLAAEASACLPRIWDVRTSLRTIGAGSSNSSVSSEQ